MTAKFFALISVTGLASICLVQGQLLAPSAVPAASPSPAKHRAHKKAAATASPAEEAASASTTESPAASPSPGKRRADKKAETTAAASPATIAPAPGGGHGLVWVNTESHVYHREGSRFYGTTKKGKYMTEQDAINEGDKAAAKGQ